MTYRTVVTREGGSWLADVPELTGAHTFARTLAGLHKSVAEVIILMADLPDDSVVDVDYEYQVEDVAVKRAAATGRSRKLHARRTAELVREAAEAAHELTSKGYSVRDAAVLLDMTPGRVSQLT